MLIWTSTLYLDNDRACTPADSQMTICDRGAAATDISSGEDLSSMLVACWNATAAIVGEGSGGILPFSISGLSHCNINTSVPGSYTITYSLLEVSSSSLVKQIYLDLNADNKSPLTASRTLIVVSAACDDARTEMQVPDHMDGERGPAKSVNE